MKILNLLAVVAEKRTRVFANVWHEKPLLQIWKCMIRWKWVLVV